MKHDLPESYREAMLQSSILGATLTEKAYTKIKVFLDLLRSNTGKLNLTGPEESGRFWTRHVLESLAFIPFLTDRTVIDVGTGAGFPGMILAACGFSVTMVESRSRRCSFLDAAARECGIACEIRNKRIQEAGTFPSGSVFTSRAVKKPNEMIKLIEPSTDGSFLLVTRVSNMNEKCNNSVISERLPVPPLDRSGFILQYRHPTE